MNILFVHSGSDLYGASRSLLRLASRLVRDGHGVTAVLPSDGPLLAELRRVGADARIMLDLPLLKRSLGRNPLLAIRTVAGIIPAASHLADMARSVRADIIHTNTATVLLAPALAARRVRIPHVWHVREFFSDFGALWPLYRAAMLRNAQRIVCVSHAVAEQFGAPLPDKVVVVHNGFPAGDFANDDPRGTEAFRRKFQLGDAPLIGLPGRIKFGRKGQDVFIQAAGLLRELQPKARFLVIGSPFPGNDAHLADAIELVRALGLQERVIFTGDMDNIHSTMCALDVVVLASTMPEPFAGIVVEAMACSKPVVGTRTGGTVEQILDGVTGILVAPNDAREMAAAVNRLLADTSARRAMGEAGHQRYLEHFEFEPFYKRITALYHDLAG